ncbi:MAG: hypothetical protein LBF84_02375 [Holosporales bacterium]|nr:hypothetical protein [Holosporales bacterium]
MCVTEIPIIPNPIDSMTDVAPERPSVPEHSLVPSVTPFSRFGITPMFLKIGGRAGDFSPPAVRAI